MSIEYVLADPTGNVTGLIESIVPIEMHPEIAEALMQIEPSCEQVGFLLSSSEGSDITLRMAGGEFCGNATMSTAAYYCKTHNVKDGETKVVNVKVIGTKGLIPVTIQKFGEVFKGTIEMPVPRRIFEHQFYFDGEKYNYPVVEFEGISHVIIENNVPVYFPEAVIKSWCDELKVSGLGLMLLNDNNTTLRPLVYVKNPETLVWESSCASGTTAVGAYFREKLSAPVRMELKEPGGKLIVEAGSDGKIKITGSVTF